MLVDAPQLENALLNLCINARDAMPDGGELTIAVANRVLDAGAAQQLDLPIGEYVCLSVQDTGTGMSADVMSRCSSRSSPPSRSGRAPVWACR